MRTRNKTTPPVPDVIPWESESTQESWQALQDHFGYVVIEFLIPVVVPYYFKREGWDGTLKVTSKSSYQEMQAQRSFEGVSTPYRSRSGNFYRVVAE